jgi:hypothetical protein
VECNTGLVGQGDARAGHLKALLPQPPQKLGVERPPAAHATMLRGHVDGDIGRPAVGGSRPMGTGVSEADHLAVAFGDQPGMGRGSAGDPLCELRGVRRVLLEGRGAFRDLRRVNGGAGGGVAVGIGATDGRWVQGLGGVEDARVPAI